MTKNVHVVPKDGQWAVKREKASRSTRVVETQKEAIDIARELAKNSESEMFIHRKDGSIRERNTYGSDPFPPKG